MIDLGKRCGFKVPRANIGAMRLPKDEDEAVALIRHAIDSGMKYIDTSRGYGDSEIKVGKALKDGYRERVILSSKWSPWNMKIEDCNDMSADCMRKQIDESLERIDVDYLDFYQVWSLMNPEQFEQMTAKGGLVDGILKAIDEGIVRHAGMTTHDSVENIVRYIEEADWCEVILCSYNFMNQSYAPVFDAARKKGIGTMVMNPVGGGMLAEPSPALLKLAHELPAASVPDLAIRWVLSNPAVDMILSGITGTSVVDDTVASAKRGAFSAGEMARIKDFLGEIAEKNVGFCTGCKYCMPCPEGVNIPQIMTLVYYDRFLGIHDYPRRRYRWMKKDAADKCVECGECEEKCTQKLNIIEQLKFAAENFPE